MVDKILLKQKMTQLEEYISDIEEITHDNALDIEMFCQDKKIRRFAERTLHLAIECCLDIGSHIVSDEGFRVPATNKDIFLILYENKVIQSRKLTDRLQKMAQFRNLLVHDYARIEAQIVYHVLHNNLHDIKDFAKSIKINYF